MRVLIVGGPETTSLGEELEAAGVTVDHRDDDAPASGGPREIAEIAADLREFEKNLSESRADAVLVASSSAAALAAVIVATKAGVPVARLQSPGDSPAESANARLIAQLADIALAREPAAIVEWARDGYPARA
jgi:adenine/guanine phosphoribosyltransferase-like PRPP-binding protein